VISDRHNSIFTKQVDDFAHASDGRRVHDHISTFHAADGLEEALVLHPALAFHDEVPKILPAKARNGPKRVFQSQLPDNVMAHSLRGAGGKRRDRMFREHHS
jgi:hypothetical protein